MKPQRRTTKAEETSRKRLNQIYVAAAQLFCDKGFDATSMNDIAEAVGLTKAGVYHFISGGKQDLLFAVMNYGMDRLESQVIAPAQGVSDAEQRLRTIINNHAELITGGSGADGHNPVTIVVDEVAGADDRTARGGEGDEEPEGGRAPHHAPRTRRPPAFAPTVGAICTFPFLEGPAVSQSTAPPARRAPPATKPTVETRAKVFALSFLSTPSLLAHAPSPGQSFFASSLALIAISPVTRTGERSSNAGGLIRWPVLLCLPVGFGLLLLQACAETVKRIALIAGHGGTDDGQPR